MSEYEEFKKALVKKSNDIFELLFEIRKALPKEN